MDSATRDLVIARAGNRCEYCLVPQGSILVAFHVEHIIAQQHLLDHSLENLALSCPECNRFKGPNLATLEPVSRQLLRLFHPRLDRWSDHFQYRGPIILGKTDLGEGTIRLLQLNSDR